MNKALLVEPTRCRFCRHIFLDMYYLEEMHVVKCKHCGKINAKVSTNDIAEIICKGIRSDIGFEGRYSKFLISKKGIISILKKVYKKDWEFKLEQIIYGAYLTEEGFHKWFKIRKKIKN